MTINKNLKNLLICNSSFYGQKKLKKFKINNYNILKKNFINSNKLIDYLKKCKKEINAIFISLETPLSKKHFDKMSNLKYIFTPTTGTNHILNKPQNVKVFNLNTSDREIKKISSTPELIIGLVILFFRKIFLATNSVKKNNWQRKFFVGNTLKGKTIGIIGYGRIGKKLETYCKTFEMKVLIYEKKKIKKNNQKFVNLKNLISNSDIISLNINYNEKLKNFFDYKYFKLMKKTSLFVNTSRGELISENCLIKALKKKIIAGAILDVLSEQKIGEKIKNKQIIKYINNHNNLIITPHIGGVTHESFELVKNYTLNQSKRILELKKII